MRMIIVPNETEWFSYQMEPNDFRIKWNGHARFFTRKYLENKKVVADAMNVGSAEQE